MESILRNALPFNVESGRSELSGLEFRGETRVRPSFIVCLCFAKMDPLSPDGPLFTFKGSTNLLCFGGRIIAIVISRSDLDHRTPSWWNVRYVVAFPIRLRDVRNDGAGLSFAKTSSVCCPSVGGGRRTDPGVA